VENPRLSYAATLLAAGVASAIVVHCCSTDRPNPDLDVPELHWRHLLHLRLELQGQQSEHVIGDT